VTALRCLPAGDGAVLAELGSLGETLALFQALGARPAGVEDVIPAARTLLVPFDPAVLSARAVAAWLRRAASAVAAGSAGGLVAAGGVSGSPGAGLAKGPSGLPHAGPAAGGDPSGPSAGGLAAGAGRRVEIPVRYAGEDLEEVAGLLGLTRAELIERHTGTDYLAAFAGFAPGFVYLAGGDPCFHGVPRRAAPRVRVPAGSVAVAGDFSAVYPSDSPGGWQLLGATPWRMWDMDRAEPALVQPGFRVRFRDLGAPGAVWSLPASAGSAGAAALAALAGSAAAAAAAAPAPSREAADAPGPSTLPGLSKSSGLVDSSDPSAASAPVSALAAASAAAAEPAAACEVLDAGLQTLVQDEGRPGLTRLGVSRSGALDRGAMRRANRLVDNPPGLPVLEHALGGLRLVCRGRAVVAVTGATAPVVATSASGMRLPAAAGHPIELREGDELRIGRVRAGVRCYVAVRGGWAVRPVLGSCATDILAGLGPAPLRRGDRIPIGRLVPNRGGALDAPGGDAADAPEASGAAAAPHAPHAPDAPEAPEAPEDAPPRAGERVFLDVIPGPRDDWFEAGALHRLLSQDWIVTPQSNRVGMRLAGAEPLVRSRAGELPSEGTVAGALQVPPSGQPVLFLADHPLTGGYPVIAVVPVGQLDRLAQVPVGAVLRFRRAPRPL
jgi:biotin-dependent carboxylase-like uncharacterized protein